MYKFLAWALLALLCSVAQARDLVLAISEGSSGGTDHARVLAKYGPLAEVIGKSIDRKVSVIFIREFAALDSGLKQKRFDLAIARPSDYPARAMRDHGYRYVASAQPDGQCLIVTTKAASYKDLADIKGARIALPNPAAYMTKFCAAELRNLGFDLAKEKVTRVREQGAVPFFLNNKFGDVGGVASYSGVAKSLDKNNLRVLHKSIRQPYFPLVASSAVSTQDIAAIQKALNALASAPDGQQVLARMGIEGFDTSSEKRLRDLLPWLGL